MGQMYWNWIGLLGWAERSFCVTAGAEYKSSAVKSNVAKSTTLNNHKAIIITLDYYVSRNFDGFECEAFSCSRRS